MAIYPDNVLGSIYTKSSVKPRQWAAKIAFGKPSLTPTAQVLRQFQSWRMQIARTAGSASHSGLTSSCSHGNVFLKTGPSRGHYGSRRSSQRAGVAAGAVPSPLSWACAKQAACGVKAAAADAATAADSPAAAISASLRQLQHSASSLDAEPSVEGLLTAFQQLSLIQKQLQQESRQCKLTLFRLRRNARKPRQRVQPAGAASPDGTSAAVDEAAEAAQAQLAALNQLRAAADDAQDFLLSLVQQLLQDQPPSACSQLLTSSAFRKLNVEALNRLTVNTFVDKQADASPQDMAGLMAALALVRCCSSYNQVAGFERSQLSTLFSGIMSHLLAHVGKELQQQQQQQQQPGSTEGRRRRQPAKTAPASAPAAAAPGDPGSVDADAIRQQVAAALAAHVSARVPFNSTLAPHVLHILQDKAPKWVHTIADVEAAPSISHLSDLMSHSSRYDYTLLAAAFNRLAELSEQQQAQLQADPDSSASGLPAAAAQQQQRLVSVLVGRMRQLQADATGSELPVVLTAAVKLGVRDGRFFGTAAANAASADNLSVATDAYLAAVMYAVAAFSSSGVQAPDFSREQQHGVLRKCLERLVQLVEQQARQRKPWSAAAAADAAITGAAYTQDTAAASSLVQPSNALMALWAAASAGLTASKHLRLAPVFEFLAQPSVLQQLTSSSSQQAAAAGPAPDEVARSCGTILWAASQLGFDGGLDTLKPYAAAFMDSARATPVPCGSILTVVLSLATVLNRQQQQQEEAVTASSAQTVRSAAAAAAAADLAYWQSCFLQCSQELICSLQQRQHDHQQATNSSSHSSSDTGMQDSPADDSAAAAAASQHASAAAVATQLLWAYEAVGLRPSHEQLEALMQLTQEQAPQALVQLVWQHILAAAATVDDVHQQLQCPASVSVMADLDIGAAVLQHIATLQQQNQVAAAASGRAKAVLRDCCSIISQQLLPTLQGLAAPAADTEAADSQEQLALSATAAESAAAVMWSTAQLQHRDAALAAASLQVFVKGLDTASAPAAAAVLVAMSEAGRAVSNIYSCDRSTLLKVMTTCTSKVLQSLAVPVPVTADGSPALASAAPAQLADIAGQAAEGAQHASTLAGLNPAVLAQRLLQLHLAVGLQPSAEHTFQLLSLVASESHLNGLRDNAASAAVVASLSTVAELSQLPGWQGIRSSSSSQDAGSDTDDSSSRGRGRKGAKASSKQQLQFPWAWQCQQQQLVEELWQQLLLGAFLPRISSATGKQVASALEAVVQLAGQGGSRAGAAAVAPDALDIGLAKDVARAVLDVVAPQTFSSTDTATAAAAGWGAASAHTTAVDLGLQHQWRLDNHAEPIHHSNSHPAGSASSTTSAAEGEGLSSTAVSSWESDASADFLSAWRPGEWKGEHLATLAAAIAQLEVSRPAFFAAVEADLLGSQQAAAAGLPGGSQQQPGRSRVASVQLQHVVEICCAAAALHCRVEQLLTYAVQSAVQQLQEALEASTAVDRAPAKRRHTAKVNALDPELLLLLSWAVAAMDVPQLAQQAQQLAAAAINALKAGQAGAAAARHGQQADWELPDALAARAMQLHVWLMDSHAKSAGSMSGSDSRRRAGLSDVLSSQELQAAAAAWISLQQHSSSPATCLESVRASLGRLLHQPVQTSINAATADALVLPDVTVVAQGVPVAVLLLGDVEEGAALQEGDLAAAAAESLAADWVPTAAQQGSRQPQQGKHSSSTNSSQRVQAVVSRQHLGDVMFRAKALAHRGYWVEVISSRQWLLLEGHLDAQEEFLRERLWPLVAQAELDADDAAAAQGSPLDSAAVPQAV